MPGNIRTAVRREIWNKILGKINVKINKCDCFKTKQCSTESQCNFLSTIFILVYVLVFDAILAALY